MEVESRVQEEMHFEESFVDNNRKLMTPDTDWSQQKLIYMQMFCVKKWIVAMETLIIF